MSILEFLTQFAYVLFEVFGLVFDPWLSVAESLI